MKTYKILLAALAVFMLSSCQKDNEDTIPEEEVTANMLIQYKSYYSNGSLDEQFYMRHHMDVNANILHVTADTVSDRGWRHYFDSDDRYIKVAADFSIWGPGEDSVVITRPSANTVVITNTYGNYVLTAVTTDLGNGRKKVHVEPSDRSISYAIRDYYMRADGKMDSAVSKFYTSGNVLANIDARRITYNASNIATSVVDVWNPLTFSEIQVTTHTITRDNNDNSVITAYIENRWGSDLGWLNYNLEGFMMFESAGIFYDDYMADILMVNGGTITSYSSRTIAYDRATLAPIRDQGTEVTDYTPVYYPNSRLQSIQAKRDGQLFATMELSYYD